jgi:hypothetical protein
LSTSQTKFYSVTAVGGRRVLAYLHVFKKIADLII